MAFEVEERHIPVVKGMAELGLTSEERSGFETAVFIMRFIGKIFDMQTEKAFIITEPTAWAKISMEMGLYAFAGYSSTAYRAEDKHGWCTIVL